MLLIEQQNDLLIHYQEIDLILKSAHYLRYVLPVGFAKSQSGKVSSQSGAKLSWKCPLIYGPRLCAFRLRQYKVTTLIKSKDIDAGGKSIYANQDFVPLFVLGVLRLLQIFSKSGDAAAATDCICFRYSKSSYKNNFFMELFVFSASNELLRTDTLVAQKQIKSYLRITYIGMSFWTLGLSKRTRIWKTKPSALLCLKSSAKWYLLTKL